MMKFNFGRPSCRLCEGKGRTRDRGGRQPICEVCLYDHLKEIEKEKTLSYEWADKLADDLENAIPEVRASMTSSGEVWAQCGVCLANSTGSHSDKGQAAATIRHASDCPSGHLTAYRKHREDQSDG